MKHRNIQKLLEYSINSCILSLEKKDIVKEYGKENLNCIRDFAKNNNILYEFHNKHIGSRLNLIIIQKSKIYVKRNLSQNKSQVREFLVYKLNNIKFFNFLKNPLVFILIYLKILLNKESKPILVGFNATNQQIIIRQKIFDDSFYEYGISKKKLIKIIIKQIYQFIEAVIYSEFIFLYLKKSQE